MKPSFCQVNNPVTKTTGVYPNNSPLPSEKQPLCFYALTNCSPRNSFLLTFMHHMGGVWGYPYLPIEVPAQLGSRDPDPVRTFRHSNVPRSLVCPACPDSVGKPVGVTVPLLPPVTSHQSLFTSLLLAPPKRIIFPQHGRRC